MWIATSNSLTLTYGDYWNHGIEQVKLKIRGGLNRDDDWACAIWCFWKDIVCTSLQCFWLLDQFSSFHLIQMPINRLSKLFLRINTRQIILSIYKNFYLQFCSTCTSVSMFRNVSLQPHLLLSSSHSKFLPRKINALDIHVIWSESGMCHIKLL